MIISLTSTEEVLMIVTETELRTMKSFLGSQSLADKSGLLCYIERQMNTIGGWCHLCDELDDQQLRRAIALFQSELDSRQEKRGEGSS
jgi:hypothetical protein